MVKVSVFTGSGCSRAHAHHMTAHAHHMTFRILTNIKVHVLEH